MKVNLLIKDRLKINNKVIIISAYLLKAEEIEIIKKTIPELAEVNIEYAVDKTILAGIVIKVGSLIIDQSLATKVNKYFSNLFESV